MDVDAVVSSLPTWREGQAILFLGPSWISLELVSGRTGQAHTVFLGRPLAALGVGAVSSPAGIFLFCGTRHHVWQFPVYLARFPSRS